MQENIAAGLLMSFVLVFLIFAIATLVLRIAALWRIFQKAGYEGWEAIIPFYNMYVLLKIVGKPGWWLAMMFIPIVNIVYLVWTFNMLAKSFGKDEGYTVGLVFLGVVFLPILGFGSAQYIGPYGDADLFRQYQSRMAFNLDEKRF